MYLLIIFNLNHDNLFDDKFNVVVVLFPDKSIDSNGQEVSLYLNFHYHCYCH